jgi:hypothetical protein
MEMSPSREITSLSATQEIPNILWNSNAYSRVHNKEVRPPPPRPPRETQRKTY